MPGFYTLRFLLLINVLLISGPHVFAQKDPVERLWYNDEKTAKIEIFKAADGKFYGKIVWLKEPLREGKPKVDIHNPDASKRNDPIIGLMILKGFKKDGATEYHDGTVYDPKNGKTYSCKMYYKGDKLEVRGYYGISIIGRSTTWTKAQN
jgi:uncharacterized protein (DUF2147 family)